MNSKDKIKTKIKFIFENYFEILLSIPKTVWFNFKILTFKQACKLPFFVSYHVSIVGIDKSNFIVEKKDLGFASMRVGFGYSDGGIRENKKGLLSIKNGKIILKGIIGWGQGLVLECYNGIIIFGDNFRCNYSCSIHCQNSEMVFGSNISLGWCVTIKNYDGHNICENGILKEKSKPIKIGNHSWICSYSDILKGVQIGNDCVVAYRSLACKTIPEDNLMYAGCPAKIVKRNINWQENEYGYITYCEYK